MIDLIPLAVYLACLGGLMWMHYQKVTQLEKRVNVHEHTVIALTLALRMHLNGESVSLHTMPLRMDEEE